MPATRTQIYITEAQRVRIDEVADRDGVTMAEVIRRALDSYLDNCVADPTIALDTTFGAIVDLKVPHRDEWARG